MVKSRKKLPIDVSEEEFRQIIAHTKKTRDKVAFLLAFNAGLRVSEVVNLKRQHFRPDGFILIENSKRGKDRAVPIPKHFRNRHLDEIPIKVGARALQKSFLRAVRASGLHKTKPNLHFHSLRHGFAKRCLEKGMPLNQLQLFLGHDNIKTTSVYTRANPIEALDWYKRHF